MPDDHERLSAALAVLHWGPGVFARVAGIAERSARRMLKGEARVPEPLVIWAETLARHISETPPPTPPPREATSP